MSEDLYKCQKELYELSAKTEPLRKQYKQAKQVHARLKDLKKSQLAKMEIKHTRADRTQAEIQRLAAADEEYISFIEEIAKAFETFNNLEVDLGAYSDRARALITLISIEKEKMKML